MRRVVVFTRDVVGRRMAGPGIRALHIARELAGRFPVTLVARLREWGPGAGEVQALDSESADGGAVLRSADVIVGQPSREILALGRSGRKLVFDLFDPVVLELQELWGGSPSFSQRLRIGREWGRLRMALRRGDLLVAATRAQRDFYAGVDAASGGRGIPPERWVEVPFGLPAGPAPAAPPLADVPTILWGGGTWEWLDPMTAVEAIRMVNLRGTPCRLLFMGGKRPNEDLAGIVGDTSVLDRAVASSGGTAVRNDEWVPYEERWKWVGGSSVAIMLHRATAESEYSIRTRLFDAIWCGVPVVATAGGFAAELVAQESLGIVVPPGDPEAVARAVERLLTDDGFRSACVYKAGGLRARFAWDSVVRPLAERIERWQ